MQWTSAPNIEGAPLPQRARGFWKARFLEWNEGLEKLLEAERAQLPPWLVIGFGSGIAAWFALDRQSQWAAFLCAAGAVALLGFAFGMGRVSRALGWFALAATLGCALVWARATWVAEPRLSHPEVVQMSGVVTSVDYLASREATRLTIKPHEESLPPLARVSVDDDKLPPGIARGAEIELRARLVPPPPMALPGTYDFARDAWFNGLGAVG